MPTQIKVLRENVIKALSNIKDDNVSIGDIAINRRHLLEALKLQTQLDAELLTINYGLVTWYDNLGDIYDDIKGQPCIQISCNHTTMRFLNKPKTAKNGLPMKVIPLNFVDHTECAKPELSGTLLDTQELIKALSFVIHGIASERGRPVLNCALFEGANDTLTLAATDGFRLSIAKLTAKGIPASNHLIHQDDIPKLLTFLKSNTEGRGKHKVWLDTYIDTTEKTIKFMSEKGMAEFDKQSYKFPEYKLLIPKDGHKIECIASQLLEATKAISVMARDGSGIVRLHFHTGEPCGKIVLTAKSEHIGNTAVDCDAIVETDCKIATNSRFLVECLSKLGDAKITLQVKHYTDPMLIESPDGKTEVIMPMFVQWEEDKPQTPEPDEIDTEESAKLTAEELNEALSE